MASISFEFSEAALRVIPPIELEIYRPKIERIWELKREKNAVILAHTYQSPQIYLTVADVVGDSLQLAREATKVDADIIVQAGVKFMAETSKVLNPHRKVLIPSLEAGCSLAESITGSDVVKLKEKYPGVPVVTYVNTNADVKAESDICCTSANAVEVVESLGVDRVIFLPDKYLGMYVASQTKVEIILGEGSCMVHERFTPADINELRRLHPGLTVMAHPECPPNILELADYVGSTSGMSRMVRESGLTEIALITECSMSANIAALNPSVNIVRPCQLCPHMQRINLDNIITCLENEEFEITIQEEQRLRAKAAIDRMLEVRVGVRG
ncbi:MAG: quinolinate synthase NadA [Armatimonadetes bacterium]|nr:quinolinate synthase NadA [Armatimonadota bacterium]